MKFARAIRLHDVDGAMGLLGDAGTSTERRHTPIQISSRQDQDSTQEGKLPERLVDQLALELASAQLAEGQRFTCESAVAERFDVGIPVARQAIRILEDMGAVHTQRGGSGGLMFRRPLQASIVRQLFAYLLGMGISDDQRFVCTDYLMREGAAIASLCGQRLTHDVRARWLEELTADPILDARRFVALETRIHEMLGNHFLAICVRAFASYDVWHTSGKPQVNSEYLMATRELLDCIGSSDMSGAYKAQARKNQLLREQMLERPSS